MHKKKQKIVYYFVYIFILKVYILHFFKKYFYFAPLKIHNPLNFSDFLFLKYIFILIF